MLRRTSVLLAPSKRVLALSVYFKQPELDMKEHEILSRASAFLLSVDPLEPVVEDATKNMTHEKKVDALVKAQDYKYKPAGGPRRPVQELNWLEFCPPSFRPQVHVMAASHVLAPWLWNDYYPQPCLKKVKQEHCSYVLEVFNEEDDNAEEALAKVALSPHAIHHPNQKDLAMIHLSEEDSTLSILKGLNVEVLYLRDVEEEYKEGDTIFFEGFSVKEEEAQAQAAAKEDLTTVTTKRESSKEDGDNDDNRIFASFKEEGSLLVATHDRFVATTEIALPEGLCGGPALDTQGRVCGIIEGIVPKNHDDERIAGAACFLPNFTIIQFLNYAEKIMLEKIVPPGVFQRAQELKETGQMGNEDLRPETAISDYENHIEMLKKTHTPEEIEAIKRTIARERDEVINIMDTRGGELEDVIEEVRKKTIDTRDALIEKHMKEAELVEKEEETEPAAADGSSNSKSS